MGGSSAHITNAAEKFSALDIQTSSYGVALPIVYGRTKVSGNLLWFGNFQSHEHRESQKSGGKGGGGGSTTTTTITYTYSVSAMLGLCEGIVMSVGRVWVGDSAYSSLSDIGLTLARGTIGQSIWSTVRSVSPSEAIPYSGIAYVCGTDYDLGESAKMRNHQFEVTAKLAYSQLAITPDVNPADILSDILTNTRYGAGFPAPRLNLSTWKRYCAAAGLLMSPAFSSQESAADIVTKFAELTNSEPVWDGTAFTMIPRCEESVSSIYGSYTPDSTPVFDLDDEDFLANDEGAVRVEIKPQADAKNSTSVEYTNRDNEYSTEISDAQDQADIDVYGERSADRVSANWVCDGTIARKIAQLLLQRSLYIRKTYSFSLPWTFAMLSPMDIVTLTDSSLGLDREPVRITSVSEGSDGCLDIEAEELLYGAATAAEYEQQKGAGFVHNFAVDPGNVEPPAFVETPVAESDSGLEIAVAACGKNPNWGGCEVHYSFDGDTYKPLGKIKFGTLYGKVVDLNEEAGWYEVEVVKGEMPDANATDASTLTVVGWIGKNSSPEFFGIGSIVLTGALRYRLSGLNRGAYGTSRVSHRIGDDFVLIEYRQMVRTGGLDIDLIGRTAYFKFCSYNIYESQLQKIEDVQAYSYTIQGNILRLPPKTPVTGLRVSLEDHAVVVSWDKHTEPDVIRYRLWRQKRGEVQESLGFADASYFRLDPLPAGVYTFTVAPVDTTGNIGPDATASIEIKQPSKVLNWYSNVVDNNVMHYWSEPAVKSFPIADYIMREGATFDSSSRVGTNGNSTFTAITENKQGNKKFWLYAVDTAGNEGEITSLSVYVNAPPDFELKASRVLDITGSDATGYGENIFQDYAALVAPVNTRETWGSHYASRNWNSPAEQENAGYPIYALPDAASIEETYEYHFQSRGWSSPQDQIDAGFPVYEIPSDYWQVSIETYEEHFINNGWTTPQNQIDAGYPTYREPIGGAGRGISAYYAWEVDFTTTIPSANVTLDFSTDILSKNPSVGCHLYSKLNAGDAWTDLGESREAFSSSFRYVKVLIFVEGGGLVRLSNPVLSVSVKKITDAGSGYANASDSSGTIQYFNKSFIDIDAIQLTPMSAESTSVTALLNFDDVPHPTSFKVLLFNASGQRVSGNFNWTARGY